MTNALGHGGLPLIDFAEGGRGGFQEARLGSLPGFMPRFAHTPGGASQTRLTRGYWLQSLRD